ncbi:hypothetical protein OIY81_1417 [Cryptosporidium canis]|nr:hypothetical protein OIY81_1417 [Cryptosporidium canis]
MIQVICISIVDRSNQPLLFRALENESLDSLQFAVYSALDIVERKTSGDAMEGSLDPYLGYLGPAISLSYEYEIYGFLSFSHVKIIAILQDHPENEVELRNFFHNVYRAYVDSICNPFLLRTIETPKLIGRVDQLISAAREVSIHAEKSNS